MSLDFNDLAVRTIQSQYGASPHIIGIVEAAAKQLDPTGDIQTFYNKVFNPLTAEGVGLDIWGRIVGASRYLTVDNEDFFGFYGQNLNPMNQSPFYNTGDTDLFRLTDEAYRTLIFLKAAANIGTATLPSIKEILTALFDETVLVMNIGEMKVRVVFVATLWNVARQAPLSFGISQARILEWVAISFSRESSQPRDRICISCIGRLFTAKPPGKHQGSQFVKE